MNVTTLLLLVAGLLAANAFFVGAEFALVSARRSQIEPRAAAGSRRARITLAAMERVSLMMAAAQLGITACTLALGAVGEPAMASLLEEPFGYLGIPEALLHPTAFVLAVLVIVTLHVVLGEMVPKNLTLAAPDRAALLLGPPMHALVRVFNPIIAVLNAIANAVLRVVGVRPRDDVASAYTREQVADLVAQSRREGLMDTEEHQLVTGTLHFAARTARDAAQDLHSLVTVPPDVTPAQVERLAHQSGQLRFPVRGPAGEPTGYLHLKDLLDADHEARERPVAADVIRALPTVGPDDPLRDVLTSLRGGSAHLARVVDEHGRAHGLISLDRVLLEVLPDPPAEPTRTGRPAG